MKNRVLFIVLSFLLVVSFFAPLTNVQAKTPTPPTKAETPVTSAAYAAATASLLSAPPVLYAYKATAISTGGYHTCMLTAGSAAGSGVSCWGYNSTGQLGDGTTIERDSPVNVTTLTVGVSTVVAGGYHTCALTVSGGVKCWGANGSGQLGDGSVAPYKVTPVDVSGLTSGVRAISANGNSTCALTSSGGVKCWGANSSGQLGDGTTTNRNTPVDVSGLTSGVKAIAAGQGHACAITMNGVVKCWGDNTYGQLGDGTITPRYTPVDVTGLGSGVIAVTAGFNHTCALTSAKLPLCWGSNGQAQIGDGSAYDRYTPVAVSGLTNVSAIDSNGNHTCVLTSAGGLKCWGAGNYGQLGDGWKDPRRAPVDVSGLTSGVYAVDAGLSHTCALTLSGAVKCWGWNVRGELGDGTTNDHITPGDIDIMSGTVKAISAKSAHTCALTLGGGVKCWGDNNHGQLGDNSTTNRFVPVDVIGLSSGMSAVATGSDHSCAINANGGVLCWGLNSGGQLGDGSTIDRRTPINVSGLSSGVSAVDGGANHSCALTTSGGVLCWGWNRYGQLGDSTSSDHLTPASVPALTSGVSAIAVGPIHNCALTTAGGVKCWGYNQYGQLGDGTTTDRNVPVDVVGLTSGVTAITTDYSHSCALTTGGGVKCWGSNIDGKLGDNTGVNSPTPVDVFGLTSGVKAIDGGDGLTCALTMSGGVKCWGWNQNGQIGDGTTIDRYAPVDVSGLTSGAIAIAVGNWHACALTSGGGVKCWGSGTYGMLGNGSNQPSHTYSQTAGLASADFPFVIPPVNPTVYGQPISFTATVAGVLNLPTGTIQFQVDGINSGSPVSLSDGSASSASVMNGAGLHIIQARYSGDASYFSGWSAGVLQAVQMARTSTILASPPNPTEFGQPVTLTATVTSEYGGATSGAVTFKANGVAIAGCESANLSSGQATCTTTALGLGANTLTAEYNGDANNLASVSVGLTQTVSQRTTVTDLSSSANPSRVNQSVIFTATVSTPYGTPTGTVVFKDGGVAIGGCEAASMEAGQAACATTGLEPGIHSITAEYSGGTNDKASVSGSLSQTVKDDTVTNLVSSDNPTTAGQPVTFTAAVATSYGTPTGTVIFKDGGAAISGCAAVSLSGELKAFCTTSGLLAGLRAITAEYNGDSLHSPSVSTGLVQTVNQRITSTLLESSSNPSEIGQPVTLTAKVSGPFGTPGGTVTFKDGGEAISGCESVGLNDGQAACQTAALTLGGHTLTTEYSGDGNDVASTSNELTQTVNQRITTTSLASSANPSEIGQPVTITASVVSPYGKPTGTVVFKESSVVFPGCESVDLSNGKATCTPASLALGGHAFTAEYSGDNADLVSASSTFTQTVNKANPVVALISSFNPSALEEAVTFTATVTSTYGGAPAGKVTFKDNGVVISGCKDVSLSSGHAACTTDALAADTRKISAEYSGDATHDSAASGLDQIIIAPNCVPASFTNKTTANGLGSNTVYDVFALSSKVYAASSGGLSVSGDSGNTFANKTTANGLGSNIVYDVAADGSAIYAATAGGLSTSTDGGSTFTNKTTADGLGSNNINGVFVDGGTLYAATDGGVSISTDGGAAFTNRTTANGLGSDIVYGVYASGGTVFAATHGGLSISTDGGNTFTNQNTADGLGSNRVYDVYGVGSTVYAGTSLGLSISTDGGVTFTNHDPSNGVGGSVQGVFGSKITVWAATSGGLSISTNHGRAFVTQTTANGLGSNTVEGVYVTGGAIYAATDGGLSIGRCAPPITGVSALKQGSSIRVSWKMVYSPGVSGFYVYRRIHGGAFSILNADLIPTQNPGNTVDEVLYSLLDQQIQDGVTYEYQVKAVLTNGESEWSDIVQVKSGWLSYLPILMR